MWTSLSCDTKKNVSLYTMLHGCRYQVDRIRKNSWKIWIECQLMFNNYNSPWRILLSARPPLLRRSTMSYKKRKISWMWSRRWSQRVSSAPQRWAMRTFDSNNLLLKWTNMFFARISFMTMRLPILDEFIYFYSWFLIVFLIKHQI